MLSKRLVTLVISNRILLWISTAWTNAANNKDFARSCHSYQIHFHPWDGRTSAKILSVLSYAVWSSLIYIIVLKKQQHCFKAFSYSLSHWQIRREEKTKISPIFIFCPVSSVPKHIGAGGQRVRLLTWSNRTQSRHRCDFFWSSFASALSNGYGPVTRHTLRHNIASIMRI